MRLGWIVFPAETSSADALTALTGFKVGENEYAFAAHSLHPPRTRFVHAEFGKAERIVKDLEQATAVAIAMDAEFGIDGLAAVDNRASTLAMGLDEEVAVGFRPPTTLILYC